METLYLVCFTVGLTFALIAFFAGSGHFHLGHLRFGHAHPGHGLLAALNGFTLPAFLCWFGGAGYLMDRAGVLPVLVILFFSGLSGIAGASLIYAVLFKILLPRERVLSPHDTEMTGVLARVSDQIRPGGTGEILFSQTGARRSAAARSENGTTIPRGAEVLVLRYERGIAYVRAWDDTQAFPSLEPTQPALRD